MDQRFVERLLALHDPLPCGYKTLLLAFDDCYDEHGRCNHHLSAFATPNRYAGGERAVHGANHLDYGNPLRLRRALDRGVRVIVAHCALLGSYTDIDQGDRGATRSSFELFERLMSDAPML